MSNFFQASQIVKPPKRSKFDLGFTNNLTARIGPIIPVGTYECVPGDKFRGNADIFGRVGAMLAPIYNQIDVSLHWFFTPYRLLFEHWGEYIVGTNTKGEPVDWEVPYTTLWDIVRASPETSALTQGIGPGTLADYLNLPSFTATTGALANTPQEAFKVLLSKIKISLFPFLSYALVYNEYYRDENLTDEVDLEPFKEGGYFDHYQLSQTGILQLRNRCWKQDYFTSALPWPQKGEQVVTPIGGEAPVILKGDYGPDFPDAYSNNWTGQVTGYVASTNTTPEGKGFVEDFGLIDESGNLSGIQNGRLLALLQNATNVSINDLRAAIQLQKQLEANALGGSRYIETILSNFGVLVPDSRLQRPEFISGGVQPVVVSAVNQTSATRESETPLGEQAGNAHISGNANYFDYFCYEHGLLQCFMSIRPKNVYFQGVPKMFRRFDKFDHYWPLLANLGEQPIENIELFLSTYDETKSTNNKECDLATLEGVFGYQSRYVEYKTKQSEVHGQFRTTLDFWLARRQFATMPRLNTNFVEVNQDRDDLSNIFAVEDQDNFYFTIDFNVSAMRPMPYYPKTLSTSI